MAALSAPVCPPDIIFWSIEEKLLDVLRKFKGFHLEFEDFCLPGI